MSHSEPTFEHDCLICGQHLVMPYGVLHDCPGDRATRYPPSKFLPLPNVAYELGKKMAEQINQAVWTAFLKEKPMSRKRPPKKIEAVPPAQHAALKTFADLVEFHTNPLAELLDRQRAQAEEYLRSIDPPRTTP